MKLCKGHRLNQLSVLNPKPMFHDLAITQNLRHAPEWMQYLWEECQILKEEMPEWFDPNGEPMIGAYIDEFRKTSLAYIKAGIVAHEIRLKGLYHKVSGSFTAFCQKWLGKSVWAVDRTIRAADLAVRLMAMGYRELPANESQCRPLLNLNDEDLDNVWGRVCRSIPEPERTATNIEAIANNTAKVDPDFEGKRPSKRIEINADQWELLQQKANEYGVAPKKYLDLLLQKDLGSEPRDYWTDPFTEDEDEEIEPFEPESEPEPVPPKKRKKGFAPMVSKSLLPNPLPKSLNVVVGDRRSLLPQPYK